MAVDKSTRNAYYRDYLLKRYHRRRAEAIADMGGKCVICGTTEALEFHHRDPAEKAFTISEKMATTSMVRLKSELAKCELRCGTCHRNEHRSRAACGTMARYAAGCRCKECRLVNADYSTKYNRERGLKRLWVRVTKRQPSMFERP